jgi:hypothetical protein
MSFQFILAHTTKQGNISHELHITIQTRAKGNTNTMSHSYQTILQLELVLSARYLVRSLGTNDAAHAILFTYVNLHFLWSCDANFLSTEYTYSNHTNVSAQYVTLCLLEHILLYLYAAILTMIPSTTPEGIFPLLQHKYENLKRATSNWLIRGSCTSCWDEYNTQCESHENTPQNGPQNTNFLFPILPQYSPNTQHSACSLWNSGRIQTHFKNIVKDVFQS